MHPSPTPHIVPPGAGKILRAFGEEVEVRLAGEQTGGAFAVWVETTPPGGGPPPHYHSREDETFYVLEGRFAFYRDERWEEVPVGSTVFMPRNVIHSFKNVGETPGRLLLMTQPSGFEIFFARCADEFAKATPPDMARIMEISTEHGIHFVTK